MKGDSKHVKAADELLIEWIVLIAIFLFAAYYFVSTDLQYLIVKLSIIEVTAVYEILKFVGIYNDQMHQYLLEAKAVVAIGNYSSGTAVKIIEYADSWVRPLYTLPIIFVILSILKKQTLAKYNRTFDGNSLIKVISEFRPRIKPVVHLDFGQSDSERGAFTYMQRPFDWAKDNKVIEDKKHPVKTKETFDPVRCKEQLVQDIQSEIYRGVEPKNMDILRRLLFAIYGLWYLERYDDHNHLLDEAAKWFKYNGPESKKTTYEFKIPLSWVPKINKYASDAANNKRVQRILNQYVFQDTVLKAMMNGIPKTTTSYIIWLKAINKKLFYTMHQTGLEVSPIIVKGITDIYNAEKKLALKGERLITFEEQSVLSKSEVLSKIDFEKSVRDVFYTLDKSGFLHQDEIIELTDGEIDRMLKVQKENRSIDFQNPIHMYYQLNKKSNQPYVKMLMFYDPKNQKVMNEIAMPNGMPEPDQVKVINFYLKNKYLIVMRKKGISDWLESRGFDVSECVMYDIMIDAKESFPNQNMNTIKDVLEATRIVENSEFLPIQEFYYLLFSAIDKKVKEQFGKFPTKQVENTVI